MKYLVKLIKGRDDEHAAMLFELCLNQHAETHELWEYEHLDDTRISVVLSEIEVREETPYERWQREMLGLVPTSSHRDEVDLIEKIKPGDVCPDCGEFMNEVHGTKPCDPRTERGQH